MNIIREQFAGSFAGLSAEQMQKTTIAYEPGLGYRHRQSGYARSGGAGACRSSQIN